MTGSPVFSLSRKILANRNDHMSIKTSQAILKGCLENDDLENDDLQNDDLENGDQFLKIIVQQKKIGKRKKNVSRGPL